MQQLGLRNVSAVRAHAPRRCGPETPFDTRGDARLAALPQMLRTVAPLCGADTRVLAMKGRWPEAELASSRRLARHGFAPAPHPGAGGRALPDRARALRAG